MPTGTLANHLVEAVLDNERSLLQDLTHQDLDMLLR